MPGFRAGHGIRDIMKLGFLSNSLSTDLEKAFEMAAAIGVEGLEVMFSTNEDVALLEDREYAEALKQMSVRHGVAVSSLCAAFICRKPAVIDAPQELHAARELIVRAIETASHVGAGLVLLPFFGNSLIEVEAELTEAIGVLDSLVEAAEEAGVVLAVESTINFNQHRFLLNHFAHTDCIRIYYDTGNAVSRKLDLPTGIRTLGKSAIGGIHFKDVRVGENAPPDYDVRMGEGSVDFQAVVQALRAIGYDGWIILETPAGEDPMTNARANLAFARNLLGL